MKKYTILGSTGSIGVQAMEIVLNNNLRVYALTGSENAVLMEEQARKFNPSVVVMENEKAGRDLEIRLADTGVRVYHGSEALKETAGDLNSDTVLNALPGVSGIMPSYEAMLSGRRLLLANKESLVCAGNILTAFKREIIPVDSEHSAIFQCLKGGKQGLRRIILTSSGGPFRNMSAGELLKVTPEMALAHPNWSMGAKVTVDSALLLNKGLEVIEAFWLFGLDISQIDVLVHPQSIVHSLIEYEDNAQIAQLGTPDMRLPIQYALLGGLREKCPAPGLRLEELGTLTFEKPDTKRFPCLILAYEALKRGGNMPAVYCASGEAAVRLFLEGKAGFGDIPKFIENAMERAYFIENPSLGEIMETVKIWTNTSWRAAVPCGRH